MIYYQTEDTGGHRDTTARLGNLMRLSTSSMLSERLREWSQGPLTGVLASGDGDGGEPMHMAAGRDGGPVKPWTCARVAGMGFWSALGG